MCSAWAIPPGTPLCAGSEEVLTADALHGVEDAVAAAGDQIQMVGIQNVGMIGIKKHHLGLAQLLIGNSGDGAVAIHHQLGHAQTGQGSGDGVSGCQGGQMLRSGLHPRPGLGGSLGVLIGAADGGDDACGDCGGAGAAGCCAC